MTSISPAFPLKIVGLKHEHFDATWLAPQKRIHKHGTREEQFIAPTYILRSIKSTVKKDDTS